MDFIFCCTFVDHDGFPEEIFMGGELKESMFRGIGVSERVENTASPTLPFGLILPTVSLGS